MHYHLIKVFLSPSNPVYLSFVLHSKKTAFIIEHDFIMATYLADRVIVFEGTPAISAKANPYVVRNLLQADYSSDSSTPIRPQSLLSGMNKFLASLEITFRRDPTNFRPRVNKMDSVKDREQKSKCISSSACLGPRLRVFVGSGNYFFLED